MNNSSKKIINLIVKLTLGLGSIVYLFYKIHQFSTDSKDNTFELLVDWWESKTIGGEWVFIGLITVVVLMILNWMLEAWKWKLLMTKLHNVTWGLSVKSVLSGVAAGVFTPFRLGSYLGRVIHLPFKSRILGLVLNLMSNIAQFLVTFFIGTLGLLAIVLVSDKEIILSNKIAFLSVYIYFVLLAIGLIYAFLNIGKFVHYFGYFKWTKKWIKYFRIIQHMDTEFLGKKLLVISLVRYMVIMLQYMIVFNLIQFPVPLFYVFVILASLFVTYHFLPTLSLLELGATKAAIFILLFEFLGLDGFDNITIGLTIVTFVIWGINLFIPSVFGSVFLFQAKLLKEK